MCLVSVVCLQFSSPLFTSQVKYENAEICLRTVFVTVENNEHSESNMFNDGKLFISCDNVFFCISLLVMLLGFCKLIMLI